MKYALDPVQMSHLIVGQKTLALMTLMLVRALSKFHVRSERVIRLRSIYVVH